MPKHSLRSPSQPRTKRKTPSTPNVPLNKSNENNENNNNINNNNINDNDGSNNKDTTTGTPAVINGNGFSTTNSAKITPASINEYELVASQTWAQIGFCSLALNLFKIAIKSFDNSLRHLPDNVDSIIGLSKALKLDREGNSSIIGYKHSTELIISAIQQFPNLNNDGKLWRELSESHLGLKEYEQAHQAITRALNLYPNDPELLYLNSEILMRSKNYDYVKHILHTILSIYQNKENELVTELDHEIIRNTHAKLGALFVLENNFKFAINEYKLAISSPLPTSTAKFEEYASIWISFALLKERLNQLDEAFQIINDAIKLIGNIPRLLIANAYFLLIPTTKFFDPTVAIQLLESAINKQRQAEEEDETDFLTWYLLGRAYSLIDSARQAYDTFQISLGKGPSSPLPWLAVGSLYLKLGQLPDALAAYSQAARLQVDGPEATISQIIASATAWDGLACVYERCDDQAHDAADACLRTAGDLRASSQSEQRAHSLTAAARGEAPPPALKGPPDTPVVLLRDFIGLSSKEINESCQEIIQQEAPANPQSRQTSGAVPQRLSPQQAQHIQAQQMQQRSVQTTPRVEAAKQFHHLPLPRQSLATGRNTPEMNESSSHNNTPQQLSYQQQQQQHQQHATRTPIPGATPVMPQSQPTHPQQHPIQAQMLTGQGQPEGYVIDVNHRYNGQPGIPTTIIAGPPPPPPPHIQQHPMPQQQQQQQQHQQPPPPPPMGLTGPMPTATIAMPGPPGVLANGNGSYPPPPPPPGYAYATGMNGQPTNGFVQWR